MMTNKQIVAKLKKAKNIAIFTHKNPDPDALGAMFGLKEFCFQNGVKADGFLCEKDQRLAEIFPLDELKNQFLHNEYDLVVIVDANSIDRVDECFRLETLQSENLMIIDHHKFDEEKTCKTKLLKIELKASASQLVLDLFREISLKPSEKCATFVYAGLMGDTNRFLNSNVNKEVFEDAMFLQECGADIQYVYEVLYRSVTKQHIKVSNFLYNNIKYLENEKCGYIIFDLKQMAKLGASVEDIKEFSNAIIKIKGVLVSFLIFETAKNIYKFSMRSSPEFDIAKFAHKMGGGGHKNACAFEIKTTKRKIKKNLPIWAEEIFND